MRIKMTLRVTLEIVPFGNEDEKRTIETINISNIGFDLYNYKYMYYIEHNEYKEFKSKIVIYHDRSQGALILAQKAINAVLDSMATPV